MNAFIRELEDFKNSRLATLAGAGPDPLTGGAVAAGDLRKLLQVALANEISAAELAAAWMPTSPEVDVKIALARQSGDEANHFSLVERRLAALGFDPAGFTPPRLNPLFEYLRSLETTVERIAAGQFALESLAYNVNEHFMLLAGELGDEETVRVYRDYIQPDEQAHQQMGARLLEKYAATPETRRKAREAVVRTLEIAAVVRAKAAERLGTRRFPGC